MDVLHELAHTVMEARIPHNLLSASQRTWQSRSVIQSRRSENTGELTD